MKTKKHIRISADKTRITMREYEVRKIDVHGDVVDINHYDEKRDALKAAQYLIDKCGAVAVVVELHTSRRPAFCFGEPDTYKTILTSGSLEALQAGGWDEP